jgi:hypothetical protein
MRQASRKIVLFGMCLDLAVCGISLLVATSMLHRFPWDADVLVIRHPLRQLMSAVSLTLVWQLSLVATGAYQSYRLASWLQQVIALAAGTGLATFWAAIWLSIGQWTGLISLQRILPAALTFWALSFLCLLATRVLARMFTHVVLRDGRNVRNVLIVGSNRRATALADGLIADGDSGYKLLGFVDNLWHYEEAPEHYKQMLLGSSGDTLGLLRTLPLDEVIIALPIASSYQFTQQIMDWCSQQGIPVRCDARLFDGNHHASQVLITLHDPERNGVLVLAKTIYRHSRLHDCTDCAHAGTHWHCSCNQAELSGAHSLLAGAAWDRQNVASKSVSSGQWLSMRKRRWRRWNTSTRPPAQPSNWTMIPV